MRKIVLIIGLLLSFICLQSQTYNYEIKNLYRRKLAGDFKETGTKPYYDKFKKIIEELGGYPEIPYDSITQEINYTYINKFTGISKKVIYDRSLEWLAINGRDINYIVQYSNYEAGKIIGKPFTDIKYVQETSWFIDLLIGKTGESKVKCFMTMQFTVKDNAIKIEITNIFYKITYGGYFVSSVYVPVTELEVPIAFYYPITNYDDKQWKERLSILKETTIRIKSIKDDLFTYIENYQKDYDF